MNTQTCFIDPLDDERAVDLVPTPTDTLLLRHAFGSFPSGVTTLCAYLDGVPVGIAASSFTSVSLAPPLVSVCIQKNSTTWPTLRKVPRLGVSILSAEQSGVSTSLSKKDGNRFAGVPWHVGRGGSVFVDGACAWLDCQISTLVDVGDHELAIMQILGLRVDSSLNPLVFHRSRYRKLAAT